MPGKQIKKTPICPLTGTHQYHSFSEGLSLYLLGKHQKEVHLDVSQIIINNLLLTGSIKNTREAAVRFNPTPPAFRDKSITVGDPAWLLWKH